MTRLPPNQKIVDHILGWGVEHPGIIRDLPMIEKSSWTLTINGEVENPKTFDWDRFVKLPQVESKTDFHCVEGWSVLDQKWEGVLFKTIVDLVKPKLSGKYVFFECEDGYTTSLILNELLGDDVLLAHRLNGEELSQPLGGPVRLIVPSKYAYKSPMWLKKITFMKFKSLGYWESGIYHDNADVWKEQRYK